MPTRMYRNDNDKAYFIPGLGEIKAGERLSFHGEFPPPINLENFPGLIDVLVEEAAGNGRDYESDPEVITHQLADDNEPVENVIADGLHAVKNPENKNA